MRDPQARISRRSRAALASTRNSCLAWRVRPGLHVRVRRGNSSVLMLLFCGWGNKSIFIAAWAVEPDRFVLSVPHCMSWHPSLTHFQACQQSPTRLLGFLNWQHSPLMLLEWVPTAWAFTSLAVDLIEAQFQERLREFLGLLRSLLETSRDFTFNLQTARMNWWVLAPIAFKICSNSQISYGFHNQLFAS